MRSFSSILPMLFGVLIASSVAMAEVTFEHDVEPIFAKKCAGCHYPAAGKLKGDLDLETAALTIKGGATGPSVKPGDAQNSLLVGAIERRTDPFMPPPKKFDKLSDSEIAIIRAWIDGGAKSNPATAPAAAPAPSPTPAIATPAHPAPVSAIAYSPKGDFLARGGLHTVELLSIVAGAEEAKSVAVLEGHAEAVRALAFSPDGTLLAAAGGKPGREGEVKLWNMANKTLARTIVGHKDNILGVAFSPDGKQLATCSYDKLAKVWDVATGAELRTLADHVDAINTIAFSPDGKTIATGASDRTVKLWNAETGERQITLSDSTDAVLSLAISPDGKYLAAGAADKRIRVWDLEASGKSFVQTGLTSGVLKASTFAHDGPVLQVRYSPDGALLYSSGEDKRVKAWDTATITEKVTFEPQPDTVLSLALSPDGKALAVGRYDASSAVLDTATGKTILASNAEFKLAKADEVPMEGGRKKVTNLNVELIEVHATIPPSLTSFDPVRFARGGEFEATVMGNNLEGAEPYFDDAKVQVAIVSSEAQPRPEVKRDPNSLGVQIFDNAVPYKLKLKVTVPADTNPGTKFLFCKTPLGLSEPTQFVVLPSADAGEVEPNNTNEQAQAILWPIVLIGNMNSEGDLDRFKVHAVAGKELVGIIKDAAANFVIKVYDAGGKLLANSDDFGTETEARFGCHFDQEGDYFIEVSHKDLKRDLGYRLNLGEFPWVYETSPLGVQAGTTQKVAVKGFNIGGAKELEVHPPATAAPWQTMDLPLPAYENNPMPSVKLALAQYPTVHEAEPNDEPAKAQPIEAVQTVDAVLNAASGNDQDYYRVSLKKDQKVFIDLLASRVNSPVDSVIDVLDAQGNRIERAKARCVGQTFITLSDRDSFSGGIRIDNWSDMHVSDYLMAGTEIMQISRLPGYADEDISLQTYRGKRLAYFGTTPVFHAVNSPLYKVEMHPVGDELTPNGMPVFPVYWTNDDAVFENETRGDSQLEFQTPADGDYLVRVRDAAGGNGERYQYRLMLRGMQPDFEFSTGPYRNNVIAGGSVPLDIRIKRRDGFDKPVKIEFKDLPPGFSIPDTIVSGDEEDANVALTAAADAKSTDKYATFKAVATAVDSASPLMHESSIGTIDVVEKQPDIKINLAANELTIKPGETQTVHVKIDRNNGFTNRVPIDLLNLPTGVRVIDKGLNGILVRDSEYERDVKVYCEPWVKPLDQRLYLQARIETRVPSRMVFLGPPIELKVSATEKPIVVSQK